MKELFKNAIVNNIGRLVAGLLFTFIVGVITSVLVEPVMKVVELPNQVTEWQNDFVQKQQDFEGRQVKLLNILDTQQDKDSILTCNLEQINESNHVIATELAIVKSKIATIREELPALHQRFNDIENTVKHAQSLNEFTASSNTNRFSKERFDSWRQNKAYQGHSQYYDKIRSRFPRLLYQDSLKNAQSHNIAYQSFNSNL